MAIDFDEVLEELGHFGRYQQINYAFFFLPIFLSSAFTISFAFTTGEPYYRCRIPECEAKNSTLLSPPWLSNATPTETGSQPRSCERYAVNPDAEWHDGNCPAEGFLSNVTESCDELVFEKDIVTIVNQFNLTCFENKWKLTLVGTINYLGQFVGLPIAGLISDRFGRRTVMVGAMVMSSICGIVKSFAPNYPFYITMEFLEPFLGSAVYPAAFILALELVGPSRRALGALVINVSYSLGVAYLGLMAWLLPNWRYMLLALYSPGLVLFSYYWIVPESVRWLMSRGQMRAAGIVVRKAAVKNGVTLSDTIISIFDKRDSAPESPPPEKLLVETEAPAPKVSIGKVFRELFTSKILVLRFVICCICWMSVNAVYYGLSLGSVNLFGDRYVNFVAVALVEIPSSILVLPMMERLGRRPSMAISFFFTAIACLAEPFLPNGEGTEWLPVVVYLLGKIGITATFNTLYPYTSEIFPTGLRSTLLSMCSTFGRIGSMMAPQAPLLAIYGAYLPYIVFGGAAFVTGCLSLFLPETLNAKLPDTVKEAEELGRKRRNTLPMS